MDDNRIVRFDIYCPTCEYYNLSPGLQPCHDCLDICGREGTRTPEFYKEIKDICNADSTQKGW